MVWVDVDAVASKLPHELQEAMKSLQSPFAVIAGGFIRRVLHSGDAGDHDINVFVSGKVLAGVLRDMLETKGGYSVKVLTDRAVTLEKPGSIPIQICTCVRFSTTEELLRQFDFIHVKAAIWYSKSAVKWEGLQHHYFDAMNNNNALVYQCGFRETPDNLSHALWRALKYAREGFTIDAASLAELVSKVAGVPDNRAAIYTKLLLWEKEQWGYPSREDVDDGRDLESNAAEYDYDRGASVGRRACAQADGCGDTESSWAANDYSEAEGVGLLESPEPY